MGIKILPVAVLNSIARASEMNSAKRLRGIPFLIAMAVPSWGGVGTLFVVDSIQRS